MGLEFGQQLDWKLVFEPDIRFIPPSYEDPPQGKEDHTENS